MKPKFQSPFLLGLILALMFNLNCGKKGTGAEETAPNFSVQPQVSNIQEYSADITWQTDVPANSMVNYDTTSGHYSLSEVKDIKETAHTVRLINLSPNTTYYFVVESQNSGGKATSAEMSFTTKMTFPILYQTAWSNYEHGNYQAAIGYFMELLSQRPNFADAYNGLGWCYAANAIDSLERALECFILANSYEANSVPALAGRGFVYLAKKRYSSAIEDLTRALQFNQNFIFTHNPTINANDLKLGLAEAYFYRQNYIQAQAQVDNLAPQNGLNPAQAATWILDSTAYATYAEALLAWIEKLKSQIG